MIQIFDCAQNTTEWFAARAGIPTASEFHTVMASGRGGGESKTRKTYLYKLAGEVVTGEATEGYTNAHMERGHVMEDEAREMYSFIADADIQRVGFVRNGDKGASPDGLIGSNGMFEAKSKLPHLLIECLMRDDFPPEHKAQCQGALWVAEREWIDIVVYWPRLPLFVKRAYRDEAYIATMATAVKQFNEELAEIVEQVRRYGAHPANSNDDAAALRQHPLMAG
jgi:hypothetical protein